MKISAMTLGCPTWDLETLCTRVQEYGFDGVDFRGLRGELDITKLPEFTTGIKATKKRLDDAGLEVSGISTSLTVCDPDKRVANIEEAKRTIPVAKALGAKNIRIFGGGPVDKIGRAKAAEAGRECIREVLSLDGAKDLLWNFETHDHWIKGEDCKLLLDVITDPAFGALWDMGHTYRVCGEKPEQTYALIGSRVRYVHVKDAVYEPNHPQAPKDGWRYVIPGTGQLPLAESIKLLKQHGYNGWLLFEHEKKWHPDLPEAEVVFPAFVKWIRPLIA